MKQKTNQETRVVITGLGIIAPNGIGKDSFWKANLRGISGVENITCFDTSNFKTKIGAEVKGFLPQKYINSSILNQLDRFAQFGVTAAKMAKAEAGIYGKWENPEKTGICIGSGLGGIIFHEDIIEQILKERNKRPLPITVPKVMPNSVSAQISILLKTTGPNLTISTACSSGLQAIGLAFDLIKSKRAEAVLAGGVEAPFSYATFSAFDSLRVMSQRNCLPQEASCPFALNRDGFVLGEGAGIVVMETLKSARKRNAVIYAEILGFGSNSSAYHMVMPQPRGRDIAKAMQLALDQAKLSAQKIDYINAHGTSTKANDRVETMAIKNVFGKHSKQLSISSTKSMIGHTIAASGAIGLISTCLSIKHSIIPPTINLLQADPACDLNYTPNKAQEKNISFGMVNAFGFGGNNAVVVLGKMCDN
ncbi:MAG: beta-ketoacyl-[acyl-carrier-protein] synthase family protein [Candidatus Omnitrophica bacterium]|nr:beta-ketoacyl-[acyl-carrier-protein] synthase family protein [Candidatus Omnitrophota bacterium]